MPRFDVRIDVRHRFHLYGADRHGLCAARDGRWPHVRPSSMSAARWVVFAGDYLTLYLFWEGMAFASAYLVFAQRGGPAIRAAFRYLMVHITGGVVLLGGIVLHGLATGSLLFGPMERGPIEGGMDVGALSDPGRIHAQRRGAAAQRLVDRCLSGSDRHRGGVHERLHHQDRRLRTARAFPGTELLVWLGTAMALYGVVYAVLENDCRRLLAYHIVSQVGLHGRRYRHRDRDGGERGRRHAFAHILYKALLFMGAGAVIHVTGRRKLTELGGLYKTMPLTVALYMVGAFAISAFPFFSGFVTKSMVIAAAGQDHRALVVLALTMASSGRFCTPAQAPVLHVFRHGSETGGAGAAAQHAGCDGHGSGALHCDRSVPQALYALLPYPVDFEPTRASMSRRASAC